MFTFSDTNQKQLIHVKRLQNFLLALPSSSSLPFFTHCYVSLCITALQLADEHEPAGKCLHLHACIYVCILMNVTCRQNGKRLYRKTLKMSNKK